MRLLPALVLLCCSTMAVSAQAAGPATGGALQRYDVPAKPSYVAILSREFKPGDSAGLHIHKGVEMSIVISGAIQLMVKGQPTKTLHAGDSFMVPRDTPHDAKNIGTTPAVVAVTYVIDAGAPMRSPVP